jgi:hypothetical protein
MTARILNIESRRLKNPLGITSPTDFHFSEGDTIDAQVVIEDPNISLYCLDHEYQRALFVETPADVDLSQAPFYYQAQYEKTVGLFAVPYDELHRLANDIRLDSKCLLLIYSVGRSGSTLLSSSFNQLENIVSLSEPDIYTQLAAIREWDGSNDVEVSELLYSCTKVLCNSPRQNILTFTWAIKFRSFSIEIADLMFKHFPDAKTIFLYRDAETWLKSAVRAFVQDDVNSAEYLAAIQASLSPLVPLIDKHFPQKGVSLSIAKIGTLMWLSVMECYLKLHQQGVPMLAVRFKELISLPKQTIEEVFKYCDIPTTDLEVVFKILDRDSQAGTVLSRANIQKNPVELPDDFMAEVERILLEHPKIQTPHFVVPNTWRPDIVEEC